MFAEDADGGVGWVAYGEVHDGDETDACNGLRVEVRGVLNSDGLAQLSLSLQAKSGGADCELSDAQASALLCVSSCLGNSPPRHLLPLPSSSSLGTSPFSSSLAFLLPTLAAPSQSLLATSSRTHSCSILMAVASGCF